MDSTDIRLPYPDNLWIRVFDDKYPVPEDAEETLELLRESVSIPLMRQVLDLRYKEGKSLDEIGSIVLRICLAEGSGGDGCWCTLHGVACTCVVHRRLAITHLCHDVPLAVVCHIGYGTDARNPFPNSEEGIVGNAGFPLGK